MTDQLNTILMECLIFTVTVKKRANTGSGDDDSRVSTKGSEVKSQT